MPSRASTRLTHERSPHRTRCSNRVRTLFRQHTRSFGKLQARLEALLPLMTPREVSNVLWAYGALATSGGRAPPAPLLRLFRARVEATLPQFGPLDLANTAHALMEMGEPVPRGLLEALGARALALVAEEARPARAGARPRRQGSFTPESLTILLRAFASLGLGADAECMRALFALAEGLMPTFPGPYLATLLATYRLLDRRPAEATLDGLTDRLLGQVGATRMNAVACAMRSYAALGYHPGDRMLQAVQQKVARTEYPLGRGEVVGLMYAFGKLEARPARATIRKMEQSLRVHVGRANARGLAQVLWAYAKMEAWNPPPDLLAAVTDRLLEVAPQLDRIGLPMVMYAYGRLLYEPGEELLGALHERARALAGARPTELSLQGIGNILWGFQRLDYAPDAGLLAGLSDTFLANLTGGDQVPVAVAQYVDAHAQFGLAPAPEVLQTIDEYLRAHMDILELSHINAIMSSYQLLGHNPGNQLLEEMRRRIVLKAAENISQGMQDRFLAGEVKV